MFDDSKFRENDKNATPYRRFQAQSIKRITVTNSAVKDQESKDNPREVRSRERMVLAKTARQEILVSAQTYFKNQE
jgi:hypothetical protein